MRAIAVLLFCCVGRAAAQQYVQIHTPDSATICALVMRPRTTEPLPTLFQFTIYVDSANNVADVWRSAEHGYAGLIAYTRGKACSPKTPVPYVHDGADAAAVIDWIARQPWSDGRVGMYGGSYSGFTAWATAKYMPKPLKAIMVGAPVGPGSMSRWKATSCGISSTHGHSTPPTTRRSTTRRISITRAGRS